MEINLVEELDEKGRKHKIDPSRVCSYPSHQGDRHLTWINPATGVTVWRKAKIRGIWDGKSYYCESCFQKSKKSIRKCTLSKDHNINKGRNIETSIEIALGFRNCNKEKDNYNYPFDLFDPINKEKIQVRSSDKKIYQREWIDKTTGKFWGPYYYSGWFFGLDFDWNTDVFLGICMSKNYEDIEKILKIPIKKLSGLGFYIYDENVKSHKKISSQYEDFLLNNEDFEKIRDVYLTLLTKLNKERLM